jgi:hypothetical protein
VAVAVAGGALALALAVTGHFSQKITATEAAAILKRTEGGNVWRRISCHAYRGGGGYWDYACNVHGRRIEPFSFDVKVDSRGIVDQSGP